jgi:hypothetical protein
MQAYVCPDCVVLAMKERDGVTIRVSYDYSLWVNILRPSPHELLAALPELTSAAMSPAEAANVVEVYVAFSPLLQLCTHICRSGNIG